MNSQITTHVLDTARGLPAEGIPVIFLFSISNTPIHIINIHTEYILLIGYKFKLD